MSKLQGTPAFLAYLLPVVGSLYVFLFHRQDEFAVYHPKQSIALMVTAVVAPAAWAVVAWGVSWLSLVGPIIAAALFALVILIYVVLAVTWFIGMVYVSQAKMKPVSMFGGWAERVPVRS